jgi:hypothetical protein
LRASVACSETRTQYVIYRHAAFAAADCSEGNDSDRKIFRRDFECEP